MAIIPMRSLLEAGVHFGHQTKRWDPKMAEYIYQARNGIHIIDLQKTSKKIDEAYAFMKEVAEEGKDILFVGTKKQAQECVKDAALKSNMFYVDQRWLGGTLTNFKTIKKSIAKLFKYEQMAEDGTFEVLPKKEVILIKKEQEKLEKNIGGIKNLKSIPDALVVVDPKTEHNAVLEARKLNIPIFGLVDTNCDPEDVDYVIPANDDAIRSVKLIVATLANAVVEANGGTPIEVVFTDEPVAEEQKPRRNRDGKGGFQKRNQKPGFKKEVKAEQPAAEAKEAAPATEEAEAPKKERKPRAKKEAVEESRIGMTEIMPVPSKLRITVLPAGSFTAPPWYITYSI